MVWAVAERSLQQFTISTHKKNYSTRCNLTKEKLLLKEIFSAMELFFHGNSSGLDPLNSYLSLPILIHSKDKIEPTGIPSQNPEGKGAVFLLDSEMAGETAPMVSLFMKNMEQEPFRMMMKEEFIRYTDQCVEDFLRKPAFLLITPKIISIGFK